MQILNMWVHVEHVHGMQIRSRKNSILKNMEHEFLHFKARTNNWKWKAKSGLPLTIIGWCQFITCTKKFKVPDQLLTTVKLSLICNYPHYPSVLSHKLESDPTTLIEIAVCM